MFNNQGMYDYEIIESARQVASGELVLSLDDLEFLLNNTVDLSNCQKLEDELIFGVFRKLLSAADMDDDDDAERVFDAARRIQNSNIEEPLKAFDILAENGVSFTEKRFYSGDMTTLRDWLLEWIFSVGLVEKLVQLGVDMNEPVIKGKTPAYIVADRDFKPKGRWDNTDMEEELAKAVSYFDMESIEALTEDGTSAAHRAVKNNHYKMLDAMIKAGININLTEDQPKIAGSTLLHTACEYGSVECVKLLIEAGADDTLLDAKEETPAHRALFHNYITGSKRLDIEERKELLTALGNVDSAGKYGLTPMLMALNCQDYAISHDLVPVFIEKGADVNHADNLGNTPLMLCSGMENLKALVKAGADVNARNKDGNTPLHFVLDRNSSQEAAYLIKKGADFNVANNDGVTPMQLAAEKGLDELFPFMGL